ncbi:hypothetical protein ACS0TY_001162 [Phlomoides rotata]
MKLLSFNVRGIGSRRKRKLVKDLIANTKVDFVCIQETKLDIIPTSVCESLWVDKNFDWVYSGSIGSAGGLLCIWDKRKFVRDDCCSDEGFLSVSGFWESSKDILRIVNIYAPCDFGKKMVLWEKVSNMTQENPEAYWCVCGDFNSILHISERKGLNRSSQSRDIALFNSFVRDSGLYDLPLLRRRFTWYKDNGTCCSRLDRFLVSKSWTAKWPNLKQVGLKRTISDHAPGWGSFLVKEKLKILKQEIKNWRRSKENNIELNIKSLEDRLSALDAKLEFSGWTGEDVDARKNSLQLLEENLLKRDRLAYQKSKCKWIKEGDCNSSFFHSVVNKCSKLSEIRANMGRVLSWKDTINKVEARLNRWDNKFLSFGGRIILIKSVLSNLPTYALSYNRAPSTIINKLTSLQRQFLWGGGVGSERKIAWVSWEAICRENCSGGLGIKNLEWFNLALFGKWGWRVLGREGSLLSSVIESKYGSFWDCVKEFKSENFNASNWSFWWSSLVKFVGCSTWFSSNCIRVIKIGKSSKFWFDKWVGGSYLKELFPRLFRIESESESHL